jgi:hypothetical protein
MRFVSTAANIQPEVDEEFKKSAEWRRFEEALSAVAERPTAQHSQSSDPYPSATGASQSAGSEPGGKNPVVAEAATTDFLVELFDQFDPEEQAKIRAAEEATKEILARGDAGVRDRQRAAGSHDVPDWVRQPQDDARVDAARVVFDAYVYILWEKTDVTRAECISAFVVQIEKLIDPILTRYGVEGEEALDELPAIRLYDQQHTVGNYFSDCWSLTQE